MATPFLAEIRLFSFNFAPKGWAFCSGQVLPIAQNQALFSLLGTTYGGNGTTSFALPNLQGRTPLHFGAGFSLGQAGGEATHTVTIAEMPAHTHTPQGNSAAATQGSPAAGTWATADQLPYNSVAPDVTLNPALIATAGGSQPHPNQQPYLVLTFAIALQGVFPSRS